MPRIFFDTEFTSLTPGAALISIGLVDESGQNEFYAELTDTYEAADCSEFCRQEVLPLLEHGAAAMTLPEVQDRCTHGCLRAGLALYWCATRPVMLCS